MTSKHPDLPEHLRGLTAHGADSAGHEWSGRSFGAHDTAYAGDDGSADPRLLGALSRFAAGEGGEAAVVDALRSARLLIPLVAHAGQEGLNEHGIVVDKTQELSIVTVQGPDGRAVLPAFTSVDALRIWDPAARPVPADGRRVALAAASESTELLVIDPASPTEFGVRRPAVWAIAQQTPWVPAIVDDDVLAAFAEPTTRMHEVGRLTLAAGSAVASLGGPEVVVELGLRPGLDQAALSRIVADLQASWSASEVIATRVDSLGVRIVPFVPTD